jgi:hypothetical protein
MYAEYKFDTYQLAANWAKENLAHIISRNKSGEGFIGTINVSKPPVISKLDSSDLEPARVSELLTRISIAFSASIGYSLVGRLDHSRVRRYLASVNVTQLLILRATLSCNICQLMKLATLGWTTAGKPPIENLYFSS